MTQRIINSQWTAANAYRHHPRLTRYQRVLRQARRIEAAHHPFDWNAYQPLPAGEDLEARDPVEAEAWANIETEARQRHSERLGLKLKDTGVLQDIHSLRSLWQEAGRELKSPRCKRTKRVK